MDTSHARESFRGMLLRHRGRTGLIQRDFAARAGVSHRSLQDWESGANYPTAERLQALIRVLFESGGLTAGREAAEARELWAAAKREAPRMHTPFDDEWFASLLVAHPSTTSGPFSDTPRAASAAEPRRGTVEPTFRFAPRGAPTFRFAPRGARAEDWGEAPDTSDFVGRADEMTLLRHWVLDERCRLVALLGMGGVGKTSLAARLAEDVAPSFERVYWRNLRDSPPVSEWLAGGIGFLSDQQVVPPAAESERMALLLQLLRDRRCLLVLDNSETLFETGERDGRYGSSMAGYGRLLDTVGEASHQSCVMLTSREAPPRFAMLGGAVRSFELGGLGVDEAQELLAPKKLAGTPQQWAELNARFGGNGLALKVVGQSIRELFGGDIGSFLDEAGAISVFGDIRRVLTEQVERSSAAEQQVLRVLAVEREPIVLSALLDILGPRLGRAAVLEAVEALRRRSLVERAEIPGAAGFSLQSVVLEYATDRLVETVADEITNVQAVILVQLPLIQAQAKDYMRQSQERLIGMPILQRLSAQHTETGTEQRLFSLLENWRHCPHEHQGYGPGNVVNLLRLLRGQLRGLDMSHLTIRYAYLVDVEAQDASLAGAHLANSVLAEAFDFPGSVALSGDGAVLAAGTSTGQICLWRVADRTPVWAAQGPPGVVWGVALSADGQLLASGGADGTVRLWEADIGRPLATLWGHTSAVWGVALSGDGQVLASGSADGTVRLWQTTLARRDSVGPATNQTLYSEYSSAWPPGKWHPVATLRGHAGAVRGVAVSADGRLLASGGTDGTVRLWSLTGVAQREGMPGIQEEAGTGQPLATLPGHTGGVWGVALSADGRLLVSSGADGTVRLWATGTGRPLATLPGHTGGVWSVALSATGRLLASGGEDGTVRLWSLTGVAQREGMPGIQEETGTGRIVATLGGHSGGVRGVALSGDSLLLASCGTDSTVRLWSLSSVAQREGMPGIQEETGTVRPVAVLKGHTRGVHGVALSADGQLLATGNFDGRVLLWETSTGRPTATLLGHAGGVRGVALSADGRLLASGGTDGTLRLWESTTGHALAALQGHKGGILGVALSADGRLVASGGTDGTVRSWDARTGDALAAVQGHTGTVRSVALSANGECLASGGEDGTLRLWEASTGVPLATMQQGHTGAVWAVTLSADGRLVASGGEDGTVRLWSLTGVAGREGMPGIQEESSTGALLATLQGHTGGVLGVTLSADGLLVASGSFDGTVRLWSLTGVAGREGMPGIQEESSTGALLATLKGHTGGVRGVALSADRRLLATGGYDGTARLWEVSTGCWVSTLQPERYYERLDITGLTGVTSAQMGALLALGASQR
jgi:WD40 repeat protein/transcriptional regulator with XRE-family HTH domain